MISVSLARVIAAELGVKADVVRGAVIAPAYIRCCTGRDAAAWLAEKWLAGELVISPDGEIWLFRHALRQATKVVTKRPPGRRKCRWCKVLFQQSGRGRPPVYCSASCRQRAYEARKKADPAGWGAAFRADLRTPARRAQEREREVRSLEAAFRRPADRPR